MANGAMAVPTAVATPKPAVAPETAGISLKDLMAQMAQMSAVVGSLVASKESAANTPKPAASPTTTVSKGKGGKILHTTESPDEELERLRAENEALRKGRATGGTFTLKVSEKGGISVYGMGHWPITLYQEQWAKLIAHSAEITAFIKANASKLSSKS